MKVLAVQGSPHQGNTYDRVEHFREVLYSLGDVEFEHIALRDCNLELCRGCFLCFAQGEEHCPVHDDRALLESRMAEADGVVFASPVYSMGVTALMKNFVDRLAYTFHRPRFSGRYAVGIAVAGGFGTKETLSYIRMFSSVWGFEWAGGLAYLDPPRNSSIPLWPAGKDLTDEVARRFHRLMSTKPPARPSMKDLFGFHAMRTVYARMEKYSPVDYAWWKSHGWLEPGARYFTEDAVIGIKGVLPRLAAWIMGRKMEKIMPRKDPS